jgi:predicted metal-dependent HD superfamily phosphohydrolase
MSTAEEFVKGKWEKLTAFSNKKEIKDYLWNELVYRYSGPHRFYHNLNHVAYIFSLCDTYLEHIKNKAVVGFAILYHDVVYDTFRADSEEQSAMIAETHLQKLKLNPTIITHVKEFILATKQHLIHDNSLLKDDLALFLDFDLAILGEDNETYKLYSQRIRQEYLKYSDDLYNSGRKEALQKMIDSSLFHTELFRNVFSKRAKENMLLEIATL